VGFITSSKELGVSNLESGWGLVLGFD
jgi:hypothetical protein